MWNGNNKEHENNTPQRNIPSECVKILRIFVNCCLLLHSSCSDESAIDKNSAYVSAICLLSISTMLI